MSRLSESAPIRSTAALEHYPTKLNHLTGMIKLRTDATAPKDPACGGGFQILETRIPETRFAAIKLIQFGRIAL